MIWPSPAVPKEGGQLRLCTGYRRVIAVTVPDSYPQLRIDDIKDSVGQSKLISKIGLLKGYYQVRLTERAQVMLLFIAPFGLYQYVVMPFGMRNSPVTFQRIMNYVFHDLEGVHVYLDDILILANTWYQYLDWLSVGLQKLDAARLTIKLTKTITCKATVTYLGHVIGQVCPKEANVRAILDWIPPTNRKALMRFLGMGGFYRLFYPYFASVAAPRTRLNSWKWVSSSQKLARHHSTNWRTFWLASLSSLLLTVTDLSSFTRTPVIMPLGRSFFKKTKVSCILYHITLQNWTSINSHTVQLKKNY